MEFNLIGKDDYREMGLLQLKLIYYGVMIGSDQEYDKEDYDYCNKRYQELTKDLTYAEEEMLNEKFSDYAVSEEEQKDILEELTGSRVTVTTFLHNHLGVVSEDE